MNQPGGSKSRAGKLQRRRRQWCAVFAAAVAVLLVGCDGDGGGSKGGAAYHFDPATAVYDDFSGESALEFTRKVTGFGPRPPGSEALEQSRQWIESELASAGWQVQRQAFTDSTPQGDIEFVNLRARYVGEAAGAEKTDVDEKALWKRPTGVLLASHYDTKFYRDVDFVGANDPGSSIGALIEIARISGANPDFARRLELVFFDGEEAYVRYTPDDGLFGSRYYARQYRKWPDEMQFRSGGVLLDMVGDKKLNVRIPRNSPQELTARLFAAASELGTRKFFGSGLNEITDDHVPLNNAGLPTIDVIDMDYPYWHTSADRVDKLSAESVEVVGKAVLLMVEKYLLVE